MYTRYGCAGRAGPGEAYDGRDATEQLCGRSRDVFSGLCCTATVQTISCTQEQCAIAACLASARLFLAFLPAPPIRSSSTVKGLLRTRLPLGAALGG